MPSLTETPVIKSIADQTVLLKVSFGTFGNSKKVPTSIISGAVASADAQKVLKVHKRLLESKELAAITTADMNVRAYLYAVAMPFDAPLMLVPLGKDNEYLMKVHTNLVNYGTVRATLIDEFITVYPAQVADAEASMRAISEETGIPFDKLWNPSDFPTDIEEVRAKFTFDFQYHSFSVPDALKLTAIYDEAKANAEEKVNKASEHITLLMRQMLLDLVNKLKEALEPTSDGKIKRLHTSNIKNIQEFLKDFKDRNITNDSELEKLVNQINEIVDPSAFSLEHLKSNDAFKSQFSDQIAGFADKLTGLVETVPGRKFKDI